MTCDKDSSSTTADVACHECECCKTWMRIASVLQDEHGRGAVRATIKEMLEKSQMHNKADNKELARDNEERKKDNQ